MRRADLHQVDFTVGTDTRVMASGLVDAARAFDDGRIDHLRAARRVAHPLLLCALMSLALGNLAGCIVPVPLERQPTEPDAPPEIITALATPPAYSLVEHQASELFEFDFPVDDADLADMLNARLFREDNGTKIDELDNLPPAGEQSNPTRRSAKFANMYCQLLSLSGGETVPIFAIVTDRPFPDQTSKNTNGGSASISWYLKCD